MHNQKLNIDVMTLLNKRNEKQKIYLSIFINDEKKKEKQNEMMKRKLSSTPGSVSLYHHQQHHRHYCRRKETKAKRYEFSLSRFLRR